MTTASSISAKLFVGFVVASMLFTLSYTPAKAATAEELQAQIAALMAQISALQGGSSSSSSSCTTFTMDLTMGSTGAEVTALQNFLIGKGHAIAAGATGYFGGQTQAALAAFQGANGISPAAGYFGPVTRAAVNGMCTPSDDSNDDDSSNDDSNDDSSSEELSGEASLDDVTTNDGDDTDLEEGQEDAPVAEIEVEFADGDAKITRMDISLVGSGDETDPWDTFEEVSLWVDGDEVARMDASDEDEYLDEDDGSLRFTGLDIVAMEDEAVTVTVGVTVQGSVDGVSNGEAWTVGVDAIRYMDADDVSTTDTTTGDMPENDISFDIEAEGSEDEVIVKSSTEDPDATTIAVETNEKSDWTTIFAFDLDTDDSTNDIEVNELVIDMYSANDNVADLVSDVQLVIDGETFDDRTALAGTGASASTTFDIDGDLAIEAGERVTVEVQVEFKAQSGNYDEGDTIVASTSGALGDFEGADDVTGEGSATGETHTVRTEGAVLAAGDMTTDVDENDDASTTDDEGVFTIEFDVTAFETDLYIDDTATGGTVEYNTGVNFQFLTSADVVAGTTTLAATLDSTAEKESGRFVVNEGETETFTLTVTVDPSGAANQSFKVQLYSVNWNNTNADADTQQRALPAEDYETNSETF